MGSTFRQALYRQGGADSTGSFNRVLSFDAPGCDDVPRVGGKSASLGEMVRHLGETGVGVAPGFAMTATTMTTMDPRSCSMMVGSKGITMTNRTMIMPSKSVSVRPCSS